MTGLEFLLGAVVFPVARKMAEGVTEKVADKWIERIAGGFDDVLVNLLKSAIGNREQEKAVQSYLESNQQAAEQFANRVQKEIQSTQAVDALATALTIPQFGARLKYYKVLIDWVLSISVRMKRHIVLKGFLNGEYFLTYFVTKTSSLYDDEILNVPLYEGFYVDIGSQIRGDYDVDIYLERIDSKQELDQKFQAINKKIQLSQYGKLDFEDYHVHRQRRVARIYDRWVAYWDAATVASEDYNFSQLSEELQRECEIKGYEPIEEMIASLQEIVQLERADIERLEEAVRKVNLE